MKPLATGRTTAPRTGSSTGAATITVAQAQCGKGLGKKGYRCCQLE
jgi:hypothetical protein